MRKKTLPQKRKPYEIDMAKVARIMNSKQDVYRRALAEWMNGDGECQLGEINAIVKRMEKEPKP